MASDDELRIGRGFEGNGRGLFPGEFRRHSATLRTSPPFMALAGLFSGSIEPGTGH
jgi:hypothetical protein